MLQSIGDAIPQKTCPFTKDNGSISAHGPRIEQWHLARLLVSIHDARPLFNLLGLAEAER